MLYWQINGILDIWIDRCTLLQITKFFSLFVNHNQDQIASKRGRSIRLLCISTLIYQCLYRSGFVWSALRSELQKRLEQCSKIAPRSGIFGARSAPTPKNSERIPLRSVQTLLFIQFNFVSHAQKQNYIT